MFAARYRSIPSSELSFNLVNEPADITAEQYIRVATAAVEVIRREDPERLIIADGASWGAARYLNWRRSGLRRAHEGTLRCSSRTSVPRGFREPTPGPHRPGLFPVGSISTCTVVSNRSFKPPLIFRGDFVEAAQLTIRVNVVWANLQIQANRATIFEKLFLSGPGQGEWKLSVFRPEWKTTRT